MNTIDLKYSTIHVYRVHSSAYVAIPGKEVRQFETSILNHIVEAIAGLGPVETEQFLNEVFENKQINSHKFKFFKRYNSALYEDGTKRSFRQYEE